MNEIQRIIDDALDGTLHYNSYSVKMKELGVVAIALDMLKGVHTCYMENGSAQDYPVAAKHVFPVANGFNENGVRDALARFDAEMSSGREFHKELADAGVAYARCTYGANRAIYVGRNTETYIETW